MLTSRRVATIVTSTIDLGRSLGLVLVAEGIEHEATQAALARSGCDVAQGHYVSRPVSAQQIHRMAARGPVLLPADECS